jgi:hypothetical protein
MIALLTALALAVDIVDSDAVQVDVDGDVKTFVFGTFPYDSPFLPADPTGQGTFHHRTKVEASTANFKAAVHHAFTAKAPAGSALSLGSGVGQETPQLVELSWSAAEGDDLELTGRIDWAYAKLSVPHLDVTVGRQAVTVGRASMFTPLDLVAPFNPTMVDQEYKPGVDAARVDVYGGVSGQLTAVVAHARDDAPVLAAAFGSVTAGSWDLGLLGAMAVDDGVVGASAAGGAGPVALVFEATVTLPPEGEASFVRGVGGATWLPTGGVALFAEVYGQSNGADDPADYLVLAGSPRVARGELWLLGRLYAGVGATLEVTPLVVASLATIVNIEDPSALVLPSLVWSVSDEAELSAGAFMGVGARPEGLQLQSEMGLVPATAYVRMAAWF